MKRRFLVLLLCLSLVPLAAWAQSGAGVGSIEGTVSDNTGAVVPGVAVTARNTGTQLTRTVKSNDVGYYNFTNLPPGEYDLTFEMAGFAKLVQKGAALQNGARITVDAKLQVSATQEIVNVTAVVPIIETEKTETSSYVSEREIENLPINGRRFTDFVLLTPATSTDGTFGLISYRGISGLYNNNMIDGADNNQAFFSEARGRTRISYTISQATIKEFQVGTSNYSAEFGRAAGGMVNSITKSGTNTIHGEAFYFIRDQAFNAANPTLKVDPTLVANNLTKPQDRRQQFGAAVGGPLKRDKLFWFLSYDEQNRNFPAAIIPGNSTSFFATPASGVAPAFASAVTFYQSKITQQPRNGNQQIGLAKLDWQINPNNLLSSSVNIMRWDSLNGIQTGVNHINDVSANGNDVVSNDYVISRLTSVLSPTKVNEFRFQYGRDFEAQTANGTGPGVTVTNGISLGLPNFLPRSAYPDEKQWQFVNNFSWTHGRHNMKLGGEFRFVKDALINLFQGGGIYSYTNLNNLAGDCSTFSYPFSCTASTTGPAGIPGKRYSAYVQSFDALGLGGALTFHTTDYALYFQDNWKPVSNVTFNLGLRYELQRLPQPSTASPIDARTGRISIDTNNFGPRIGLSWDPWKDNKTVIRAGYGAFYGRTQNSTISNLLTNNGVRILNFSFTPTTTGSPTFPNVLPSIPTGAAGVPDIVVAAPGFANPIIHQFDFSIERQLVKNLSLSITYLGSRGQRLPYFRELNVFPPTDTATLTINCATPNAACANAPATLVVPYFRGPATNRPNPVVRHDILVDSVVNSWYNGLVVQLKRAFSHGFTMQANFTWAKSQDSGQSSTTFTGSSGQALNPYNQRAEYALSNFDQRKRFVLNGYYQPPLEHLQNQMARALFNGWKFSGVVTVGDGRPVRAGTNGNTSVTGIAALETGPLGSGGDFRAPWLGRNTFLTPGLKAVDFRVGREFKIKERTRVELTWEAFNIFNHTNVISVNSTAFSISGTTLTASPTFLAPSATSSTNYRERQMQIAARIRF